MSPYESVDAESPSAERIRKSRYWYFVIPSLLGLFVGANHLTWVLGTSPSDPFGSVRGSGLGGLLGLFVGVVLHALTRIEPN